MDPLPENILKILFQVRCGIYFDHQRDWDRFLDPLRNWVKTDERVRWSLVDFLVDSRNGNPCLGEFSSDERMCFDWLCRQLPDSSQLLYLLRRHAFDPHGEDGLPTASALRLFESKFPEDPWFRRETEQYGGGRLTGFFHSYYLDSPSEGGWTRLQLWADKEPKYRAMVHPERTYPGDPSNQSETFDLPPTSRGPIDGDWSSDSSVERLRWLLNWHGQWCPESKMLERLVGQAKAEDVPALLELAELRRDVLLEIPKISHRHPSVGEYCRRRLETAQDRWFAGLLAAKASDTALALWALDWFLEHRHDPTTSGEYFGSLDQAFERLVFCDPPMSAEEAIPRIKKVVSKAATFWFRELARTYPHHPETCRILFECDAFERLLSIEGLQPDVHERAFAMVESASAPSADVLAVLGASRSERGLRHLLRFAENPPDIPIQCSAIKMVAEHFSNRQEVKMLLQKLASPEEMNKFAQSAARRAIAWGYRGQSWAVDFLLLAERSEADALIDFVDDPNYSKWLNRRHEWREELEDILLRTTRDEGWKALDAVHGLALFFGEQAETKELFLTMATAAPSPSSSKNPKIRQGHRMADFYVWKAVICLRTAVMLWKDDPDVLRTVHAAIDHPDREFKEEAARLLSRAYSCHPETAYRLRQYLAESLIIFGEYIGLRMGDLEAMAEGLAVLAALPDTPAARAMAQDGPLYLVRFFGPRKDLLQELLRIGAAGPTWVQEGVVKALERFYRHRNPISLDSDIAFARSKALEKKDGQDWDRVLQLAKADPAPSVRLQAIEALFGRDGNDPQALDALKVMVAEGHAEGLFLLGSKCPEDSAVLDWFLGLHHSGAFSSPSNVQEFVTTCVASHFIRVRAAAVHLMDRARVTTASEEFNVAVEGLCKIYGRDAEVRAFLDFHTMDPRFTNKTASRVLVARSGGLHPADQIGLLLDILNDHGTPEVAAKHQAAHELAFMLCCEKLPRGSAENAIVAEAMANAVEHHPSSSIRLRLRSALGHVLTERGPNEDDGWKEYPKIADVLNRLWKQPF